MSEAFPKDPQAPAPMLTPAAAIIIPTIGRQVWFWRAGANKLTEQPEAATVVYVHHAHCVNLQVIDRFGFARSEQSVPLRHPDDLDTIGEHCEWMPYQRGQAAKTEQLEQRLADVR